MVKRMYLSIIRKKSNVFLFLLFFCLFAFSFIGCAIYMAAGRKISEIGKTYGNRFQIKMMQDENNPELWEDVVVDGADTSYRAYVGPRPTVEMMERIAEIEGIRDWEPGLSLPIRPYRYELLKGYWRYVYEDRLANPENYQGKGWEEIDSEENLNNHGYTTEAIAVRSSEHFSEFYNGNYELAEGRHIQADDVHVAIISQALAELNHLKIGDRMTLDTTSLLVSKRLPVTSLGAVEVQLIGTFRPVRQQMVSPYTGEDDIEENWIYVDTQTCLDFRRICGGKEELTSGLLFVDDPSEIDEVMDRVKELDEIDWRLFYLEKDDSAYRDAAAPLHTMRIIMAVIIAVILAAGAALLMLLMVHAVKKRSRESGILMALGIPARKIRRQILAEYLVISLIACSFAAAAAIYAAPSMGDWLLHMLSGDAETETYTEEEIEAAIVRGDMLQATRMTQKQDTGIPAPDSLELGRDLWIIWIVGAAELLLLLYGVNQAMSKTLRLSPKKVLSMLE